MSVPRRKSIASFIGWLSEGAAVIIVSSELPELMGICHRIYAMSGGRIRDELSLAEFDEKRILEGAFAAHMAPQASPRAVGAS